MSVTPRFKRRDFLSPLLLVCLILCLGSPRPASAATFTVNNGVTCADSVGNGLPGQNPVCTIGYAASRMASGDVCIVRAGIYRETVAPPSGTSFIAQLGESVTVDGLSAPIVSGWVFDHNSSSGSVYRKSLVGSPLPVLNDGNYPAPAAYTTPNNNQLYAFQVFAWDSAGGVTRMANEARMPNLTSGDPLRPNPADFYKGKFFNINNQKLVNIDPSTASPTALPAISRNVGTGEDTGYAGSRLFVTSESFMNQTSKVQKYFYTSSADTHYPNYLLINGVPMNPSSDPNVSFTARYFLSGKLAFLDYPFEYYYDAAAQTLYFQAASDPNTMGVQYKLRNYAFDLRGKSNVAVRNFRLFANTIITDKNSTNNVIDRINAQYVSHYSEVQGIGAGNYTSHQTDTGIILDGHDNALLNSTIKYSAGNGVAVLGYGNKALNNDISETDYMGEQNAPVFSVGWNHRIAYNSLHDTGKDGLNVMYYNEPTWGVGEESYYNNDVSYNDLYNYGRLTADIGGIYLTTSWSNPLSGTMNDMTRVHHNWTHDNQARSDLFPYAGAGIYLDNGTKNFQIDHNVSWNNQGNTVGQPSDGLRMNGDNTSSVGNRVYNNTLALGQTSSIGVGFILNPSVNIGYGMPLSSVVNNICQKPNNFDYGQANKTIPPTQSTGFYYSSNLTSPTDPLFVNDDTQPYDFHLSTDPLSPAVNTGEDVSGVTTEALPDRGAYEGGSWIPGREANLFVAKLLFPSPGMTVGQNQPFSWTSPASTQLQSYRLTIGTTPQGTNVLDTGEIQGSTYPVNSLPTGQTLYANVKSKVNGTWWPSPEVQFTVSAAAPRMTYPSPWKSNVDLNRPFTWTPVMNATAYWLYVGTTSGGADLVSSGSLPSPSYALPGSLPVGQTLYVTCWALVNGTWYNATSSFTAARRIANLTNPTRSQQSVATNQLFTWNSVPNAQNYQLYVGTWSGYANVVNMTPSLATSYQASNLPAGTILFARVRTQLNGVWYDSPDVTFTIQ